MIPAVFFPYTRHETYEYFRDNAENLEGVRTFLYLCDDKWSYDEGLKTLWNYDGDLIVLEHDIHADSSDIHDLADCPYDLCARVYRIPYDHEPFKAGHYVHRRTFTDFIQEGDSFAPLVGLGLTKIGRVFRRAYPPDWPKDMAEQEPERSLDARLTSWTKDLGQNFHLHWPEIHHSKQLTSIKNG